MHFGAEAHATRFSSVGVGARTHQAGATGPAQPPAVSSGTRARLQLRLSPAGTRCALGLQRLPPAAAAAQPPRDPIGGRPRAPPSHAALCRRQSLLRPPASRCPWQQRLPAAAVAAAPLLRGRAYDVHRRHGPPTFLCIRRLSVPVAPAAARLYKRCVWTIVNSFGWPLECVICVAVRRSPPGRIRC